MKIHKVLTRKRKKKLITAISSNHDLYIITTSSRFRIKDQNNINHREKTISNNRNEMKKRRKHTDLNSESKVRVLPLSEGTETEITGEDEKQTGTDASGE